MIMCEQKVEENGLSIQSCVTLLSCNVRPLTPMKCIRTKPATVFSCHICVLSSVMFFLDMCMYKTCCCFSCHTFVFYPLPSRISCLFPQQNFSLSDFRTFFYILVLYIRCRSYIIIYIHVHILHTCLTLYQPHVMSFYSFLFR